MFSNFVFFAFQEKAEEQERIRLEREKSARQEERARLDGVIQAGARLMQVQKTSKQCPFNYFTANLNEVGALSDGSMLGLSDRLRF